MVGYRAIKGFAGESVVKIIPTMDRVESIVGVNAETAFLTTHDNSATIQFELLQTSEFNYYLNSLLYNPTAILPVNVQVKKAVKYMGFGIESRITSRTEVNLAKGIQSVVWKIIVNDWYSAFLPQKGGLKGVWTLS